MVDRFLRPPPRPGAGLALGLVAAGACLALWFPVLIGQRTLIATDTLYTVLPWSARTEARAPANRLLGDEMLEIVPWQRQVAGAFRSGRLPLWNDQVGFGTPLLANGASAPFSPFTWAALPFEPVRGLSLAMLLKLLVAGLGMAAYLRVIGAGGLGSAVAGVAYASCSSMVVWLAWPIAGVAAFLPWAFAAVEWYLRQRPALGPAAVASAAALLLLAGHAETSLQAGLALAIYSVLRLAEGGRWRLAGGLALGALAAGLLAGVQVLPVAEAAFNGGALAPGQELGSAHLGWTALTSWLAPNLRGNPALDGSLGGSPNYSEATGFVGVGALVLAALGARELWRRDRSAAVALLGLALVSAAIVYGLLTPLTSRLPLLSALNNQRFLLAICFAAAALAGIGADRFALGAPGPARRRRGFALGGAALLILLLIPAAALAAGRPPLWLLVAALSLLAALLLAAAGLAGSRRAALGFGVLALVEGLLFAAPFNPMLPAGVTPAGAALDRLRVEAAGGYVSATGTVLIPESAALYGLYDARAYEPLAGSRPRLFWSAADPGYRDRGLLQLLDRPDPAWLAAAGVGYLVTPAGDQPPGLSSAWRAEGVAVWQVPGSRPREFAAASVLGAGSGEEAARLLGRDPLGPVVVEGLGPGQQDAAPAALRELARQPGRLDLEVEASGPAWIVVLQSYAPGWKARVDGREVTLHPADVLFQAVPVPAGRHRLSLTYEPLGARLGIGASLLGLVLVLGLAAWPRLSIMRPWRRSAG